MEGKDVPNIREYEWLKVRSVRVPEAIKLITEFNAKASLAIRFCATGCDA
ncbi:MAG: hypothetical protein ACREVJ_01980 [Gammaproteobacteria bacterium]